jgi:hypothetical protein
MATACNPAAFRLALRALRNTLHFEKITAQEKIEKSKSSAITALGNGPELLTSSHKLRSRKTPPTWGKINPTPFPSLYHNLPDRPHHKKQKLLVMFFLALAPRAAALCK